MGIDGAGDPTVAVIDRQGTLEATVLQLNHIFRRAKEAQCSQRIGAQSAIHPAVKGIHRETGYACVDGVKLEETRVAGLLATTKPSSQKL